MSTFATLIKGFQNGIAKDFSLSIPKAQINAASQRCKYTIVFEIKNKKWRLSPVSVRQQTILLFRASIYREGLMEKELN
jgi:hypothetical protein